MIHIATVHWKSDRWIQIQAEFLRRYLHNDFRVYAWLNDIPNAPVDSFYYHTSEPLKSHAVKLNILADIICASASKPDDTLIFLDGDAFPIANIEKLLVENIPSRKLLAVQRLENNGDCQPHPCFCATTVRFWREICGDWKKGHCWKNRQGKNVTDVGGNLLKILTERSIDWMPLLRSNQANLHPLFFGIYADAVYHHGAGFRGKFCRNDAASLIESGRSLLKRRPGFVRQERKATLREIKKRNTQLSEAVFVEIKNAPGFFKRFISGVASNYLANFDSAELS